MRVGERLEKAVLALRARKVPEARPSAEILMSHALGLGRNDMILARSRVLSRREDARFGRLIARRLMRIPLAHILGSQPFLDFEVASGPQALIPRPETEELAAAAMRALAARKLYPLRILDLGTGTGCLAVALARFFPRARVVVTDASPSALSLARRNVQALGLERRVSLKRQDFFRPFSKAARAWADLAVSNPPYIPTGQMARLMPEVRREPRAALDGGKDGLDALAAVIARAEEALIPGGVLALEFGWKQAGRVSALLRAHGFTRRSVLRDAQKLERIALAFRDEAARLRF